jgi:hypothetical protein
MTVRCKTGFTLSAIALLATALLSCASNPPDPGRVLLAITVTPETADAATYPNSQVTFTATGTFSVAPSPAPLPATAPYNGQIIVSNPTNPPSTIATIVSTGNGTATVQCAPGVSGIVPIIASGSANNGTSIVITGSAQLTCP